MNNRRLLIAQLMATRETLLASVAQVEASLIALDVDLEETAVTKATCPHPEEAIQDLAETLGSEGPYQCAVCGTTQDNPFHTPAPDARAHTPTE